MDHSGMDTGMDMGNSTMAGMDSGMDMGGGCKISMLWNWYTVDSCFLSSTWRIRSAGTFAVTVLGVFAITFLIEGVRRALREYDRRLVAAHFAASTSAAASDDDIATLKGNANVAGIYRRPNMVSWKHQLVRGVLYGIQFTTAFLIMLIGMYYNGYILFAIFLGGTLGYIAFARDTLFVEAQSTGSLKQGSACAC